MRFGVFLQQEQPMADLLHWAAQASGFAPAANLRARFLDGLHTTPSAYRRTFTGTAEPTHTTRRMVAHAAEQAPYAAVPLGRCFQVERVVLRRVRLHAFHL